MVTGVLNPMDGAKRGKGTRIRKGTERVTLRRANSALDRPGPEKNWER